MRNADDAGARDEHAEWCAQLIEGSREGFARVDLLGRFVFVNQGACDGMGVPREELIGQGPETLMSRADPDAMATLFESVNRVVTSRGPDTVHFRLRHRDGTLRWLEHTMAPWLGAGGELRGMNVLVRDVTALKEAEADRARLLDHLAQIQRFEAIGTLASGVVHDFNNLVQLMVTTAECALITAPPDQPAALQFGRILKAAERARDLSRRLLAFARKQDPQPCPVPLARLVDDTVDLLGYARARFHPRLHLEVRHGTQGCVVMADVMQVQRALLNLCVNACDAMPDGGTLTIETAEAAPAAAAPSGSRAAAPAAAGPGRCGVVRIRDTGTGMSEEVRQRMFEPFFTTKDGDHGTGLGLSTSDRIVRSLGGRIEVETKLGSGTTVTVWLPATLPATAPAAARALDLRHGTERILIIDDEDFFLVTAEMLLARLGYRVALARSGAEGLECFRARPGDIDVVMLDLVMPRMDGREVLRALRAADPGLPVIIASGHEDEEWLADVRAAGADVILPKPYTASELSAALRAVLDRTTAPTRGAPARSD
ncbi:MAG TPA: response regulator [Polyangia bacterium]|jgi:PAS domain S-box-containing protein